MADWLVLLNEGKQVAFEDATVKIVDGALWIRHQIPAPKNRTVRRPQTKPGPAQSGFPMRPGPVRHIRIARETIIAPGAWVEAGTDNP